MNIASRIILNNPNYISAKSYIQDGLIGHWDGIENNGYGIHGNWLSYWKDLTGSGADWNISSFFKINDDNVECTAYVNGANAGTPGHLPASFTYAYYSNIRTIETVIDGTGLSTYGSIQFFSFSSGNSTRKITFRNADNLKRFLTAYGSDTSGTTSSYYINIPNDSVRVLFSFSNDYLASKCLFCGKYYNKLNGAAYNYSYGNNPMIGGYGASGQNPTNAKFKSIRIYNRSLTEEEQKYNYNIDYKRFNLNFTP